MSTDKRLSEIFDVDYVETNPTEKYDIVETTKKEIVNSKNRQEEYVKTTIIQMMQKGQAAIEELHLIARDSEKSRDFEVLFNGMKSVTELGEKLLEIGSKEEEKTPTQQTINNTAVFVGSTKDLAKMLSEGQDHSQPYDSK